MPLEDYGLDATRMLAGILGGASHVFLDKWAGWGNAVGSIVLGVGAANYLGEVPYNYGATILGKGGSAYVVGTFASIILRLIGAQIQRWHPRDGAGAQPKERTNGG